ncbi:MAG: hypothetical protein ACK5YO_19795, partial [Planctomyces sp.]
FRIPGRVVWIHPFCRGGWGGPGGGGARLQLLQMPDRLSSLRVVVWCFAARELTESAEGWPVVNETIGQDGR